MKKLLILFVALLASCVSTSHRAEKNDIDTFITHFYDIENINDYVKSVDKLIEMAEGKILNPLTNKNIPSVKTKNGIIMAYSLSQESEDILVHYSISRPPYLPTAFGTHITGLFLKRSGWPIPDYFQLSKNQVFHSSWIIPKDKFDSEIKQHKTERQILSKNNDFQEIFINSITVAKEIRTMAGLVNPIDQTNKQYGQ